MTLNEIGLQIKQYRLASGLTQSELAKLAHLSRATLIALEKGQLKELGASKLFQLMKLLDVKLSLETQQSNWASNDYIKKVTNSANVSYKSMINANILSNALINAQIPKGYEGQFLQVIDESSPEIMLGLVRSIAATSHEKPRKIWLNILHLAQQMQSPAELWHVAS
ncbi:MAG: helix-turn-helix transcriptional regulator [Methylotenera sp.]